MKLIIDIDEEEFNRIRHFCSFGGNNIPLGWYEIAKSTPLQEELEKIKAELQHKLWYGCDRKLTLEIIDNHIAELKGENNESRS